MFTKRIVIVAGALAAFTFSILLPAQELKIGSHELQIHGFGTQGFIYTNDNNWLTMDTSSGSFAFTDAGLNVSMQLKSNLRVAAQGYDRNLGHLGDYHPQLDWGMVDWRVKPWLGFRAGKVKTVLGIYNDTQDLDFANTYALLPQSIYPIDLRDSMIAHEGGDIYGKVRLAHKLGTVGYTAYGGRRSDPKDSGYPYLIRMFDIYLTSYGGPVYGGDFRWKTPLSNLTVGVSRLNEQITGKGMGAAMGSSLMVPYTEHSKHDWTNQYYGQYTANRWHAESEYRRYYRDQITFGEDINDVRGWYVAGGFRVNKWFEGGSYYSHYRDIPGSGPLMYTYPQQRDFDKVVTGKLTVNQYTTVKVEGHFMNGYGNMHYPNGFYAAVNPGGFQNNTNALVIRTGFSF